MDLGEMIGFGANDTPFTKLGNKANEECMNGLFG
jgi:hypothetical protein